MYEDESVNGYLKYAEVPEPKSNGMLEFEGCDDTTTVRLADIKDPLKERLDETLFVLYARGSSYSIALR